MLLLAADFSNLHEILKNLYVEMMPLCSNMAGVAKGIAGLGALIYVASRVWQSLARAEPIDVYPMLRPFAIGICILFFPTIVLGTINSILSPIVQGTHGMLETQTMDMNKYREMKDKLEYESMMRNPETAYLVSNAEECKGHRHDGRHVRRKKHVQFQKGCAGFYAGGIGAIVCCRCPAYRHAQDVLPDSAIHTRPDSFCHIGLGWVSKYAFTMDVPLHTDIPVAARIVLVQQRTGEDTGVDA